MLRKIFIGIIVLLFFAACSQKYNINFSAPYIIVIKTKNIAIADSGFLKKAQNYKSLQIFSAGKILLNVELSNNACLDGHCTTKSDFNERLFGYRYYDNLLDNILDKRAIYDAKNIVYKKDGFEQKIKTKSYNIIYKVDEGSIYFKDKKNHVLIKLRRL